MNCRRSVMPVVLVLAGLLPALAAEPPPFEWNVFLGPWQVMGFFRKDSPGDSGLDRDYLGGEPAVDTSKAIEIAGKPRPWREFAGQVVDFDTLFEPGRDNGDAVAYALAAFTSAREQDAVLAIAHDDGVRAWLNGALLTNCPEPTALFLDDTLVPVRLRAGRNELLLKVDNGSGSWQAAARLLPAGAGKPLLAFEWDGIPSEDDFQVPDLTVELLDARNRVLQTLRTSGHRVRENPRPVSPLYAPAPAGRPARARVSFESPGAPRFEKTVSWKEALSGPVAIQAQGCLALSGKVVAGESGQPVAGARLVHLRQLQDETTDAEGAFRLTRVKSLVTRLGVSAEGYRAKEWALSVPADEPVVIKLRRGGKTLKGTVTDEAGAPIEGARVWLSPEWSGLRTVTDREGGFVVSGIDDDERQVHPVIERDGYAPLMQFGQPLRPEGTTTASYKMARGAILSGRVTARTDGRPLKGVRVVAGSDHHPNNVSLPTATTDAAGRYRLTTVPAGMQFVHALHDDFAPAAAQVDAIPGEEGAQDFDLDPGAEVSGRVTEPDGSPVAGARVICDTWGGARVFDREATTDREGRYVLPHMPATPVVAHVICRNYISRRDVKLVGGASSNIVLAPIVPYVIRVRLADSDAVPGKVDIWRGLRHAGWPRTSWRQVSRPHHGVWDAEAGTFSVQPSEYDEGTISFRFRVPGYEDATVELPDQHKEGDAAEIVLKPAALWRGRVVASRTGEPVEGVTVAWVSPDAPYSGDNETPDRFLGITAATATDGTFAITWPADTKGMSLLLIKHGESFNLIRDISGFDQETFADLSLPEPATVSGRLEEAGQPLADETVMLMLQGSAGGYPREEPFTFRPQAKTDAEGRFRFEGVGPGLYWLVRQRSFEYRPGMRSSAYIMRADVTALPGQSHECNLIRPAGHEVRVRTVDRDGKPVGRATMMMYQTDSLKAGAFDFAQADDDGRYVFRNVPNGAFMIHADRRAEPDTGGTGSAASDELGGTRKITVDGPADIEIKLSPLRTRARGRASEEPSVAGTIPPDFAVTPMDSEDEFKLSALRGKVVAIDFWATWCGPCMAILPETKAIWEKYIHSADVAFITFSLDQDLERLRKTMTDKNIAFPVVFSGKGWEDPVARSFGVRGIPCSFVIGRDGRFAADKMHGSELAEAIEKALEATVDPIFTNGTPLARLDVRIGFREDGTPVPGARVALKATGPDGSVAREEELAMPPGSTRLSWLYPAMPAGGNARVVASTPWSPAQTNEVSDPKDGDVVSVNFDSPRRIPGRATDEAGAAVTGFVVTAFSPDGSKRSATTDDEGQFVLPAVPGLYYVGYEPGERFAPMAEPVVVEVPESADPEAIAMVLAAAIAVRGRVVNVNNEPVPGADVMTMTGQKTKTGEDGSFQIGGISATAETRIMAHKDKLGGYIEVAGASATNVYQIVIRERAGRPEPESGTGPVAGGKIPPLLASPLPGGEPAAWEAPADANTLVVFVRLSHPKARGFLEEAGTRAKEGGMHLAAFSIDWSPEESARRLDAIPEHPDVLYAGPGGLNLEGWGLSGWAQAFLVSQKGEFLAVPPAGRLP